MDRVRGRHADLLTAALVRRRQLVLAILVLLAVRQGLTSSGDWPNLRNASDLLTGVPRKWLPLPGGLHLLANYPELQVGPLSILAAVPFVAGGMLGRHAAAIVMLAMGFAMYVSIDSIAAAGDDPRTKTKSLGVGILFMVAWVPLASGYLHLDDALTLAATFGAVIALQKHRQLVAGLLLGVAVACKPWALLFAPMLAFTGSRRDRAASIALFALVPLLAYLPFVIADPRTLEAAKPTVDVDRASVLHLFGVPEGLGPAWVRAVQLAVGLTLGSIVAWRGRWLAVPLVVVAVRIAFDPGVFDYYTAGLVAVAVVWDLLGSTSRWPSATVIAFLGLDYALVVVADEFWLAVLRLATCAALVSIALLGPGPRSMEGAPTDRPGERASRRGRSGFGTGLGSHVPG